MKTVINQFLLNHNLQIHLLTCKLVGFFDIKYFILYLIQFLL